jgi:hypothetical protein
MRLKLAGETKTPKQLLQTGEIKLNSIELTAGGTRPSLSGLLLLGVIFHEHSPTWFSTPFTQARRAELVS